MVNFMASMTRSFAGVIEAMVAWSAALLASSTLQLRLVTLPSPMDSTTTWAGVTEATYSGYAPLDVAALSAPASVDGLNASVVTPQVIFANDGGGTGNDIAGIVAVDQIPGSTVATATVTTTTGVISAPVITNAGAGYTKAPAVSVLGGGSGAVVTATISGGVVDSVTVVDGGTGYTAATLVFDPPLEIVGFYNFPNPVPMNNSFNQLPVVAEFDMAP